MLQNGETSFHGATNNQDLNPALKWRDTRPLRYRFSSLLTDSGGALIALCGLIMIACAIVPILVPMDRIAQTLFSVVPDLVTFLGIIIAILARGKVRQYQFRGPLIRDEKGEVSGEGIMLVGKDRVSGNNVWFSNDDLRTHVLVFGSTGSGKSRFLLGILYQSMLFGSGAMFVDGKADNTIFWLVYSLCRRVGREDDLLILNYLTSGEKNSSDTTKDLSRLSNTTNPFAYGNSEELRSLIVGLMPSDGGGDMWSDRASAMMKALLGCLTYMRDRGDFNLDVRKIRNHMTLDAFIELSQNDTLPEAAVDDMRKYLLELPGFTEEDAYLGNINSKAYEQHGYLQMQLTGVLSDLSSTYQHIFDCNLGEIDYKDVVFNRRILFVMLPSLEKDPSALAGLGKLVVAGVRSALAPALGSRLEGRKQEVIDQKPTNSDVPFLLILDEYGYYAVKGFAVVAAQARSLGVSVFFAGQDFPSFTKADETEAKSTVANTNIKICMKLEDPNETLDIIKTRAGQVMREESSGSERNGQGYKDQDSTRINTVDRINLRDLVNQKPGEAHIIWKDELCRARLFYADPYETPYAKLNKFLMVNGPSGDAVSRIKQSKDNLKVLFNDERFEEKLASIKSDLDESNGNGLNLIFSAYKAGRKHKLSPSASSSFAVGCLELSTQITDELMFKATEPKQPKSTETESVNNTAVEQGNGKHTVTEAPELPTFDEPNVNAPTPDLPEGPELPEMPGDEQSAHENETTITDEDQSDLSATLPPELLGGDSDMPIQHTEKPVDSVKADVDELSQKLKDLLRESVASKMKTLSTPVSPAQKASFDPATQITDSSEMVNSDTPEEDVEKTFQIFSETIAYPEEPMPDKLGESQLAELLDKIHDDDIE